MKADKYEIKLVREESETERIEAYNKISGWLLKRYYGGCEGFGCAGVFEVSTEEQAERGYSIQVQRDEG